MIIDDIDRTIVLYSNFHTPSKLLPSRFKKLPEQTWEQLKPIFLCIDSREVRSLLLDEGTSPRVNMVPCILLELKTGEMYKYEGTKAVNNWFDSVVSSSHPKSNIQDMIDEDVHEDVEGIGPVDDLFKRDRTSIASKLEGERSNSLTNSHRKRPLTDSSRITTQPPPDRATTMKEDIKKKMRELEEARNRQVIPDPR